VTEQSKPTPFLLQPGRDVPPGARRWDASYWLVYALGFSPILVREFQAIAENTRQRREVAQGIRDHVDYCHRTITEIVCALACFHPDDWNKPFAKLRRLALIVLLVWMIVHFVSNARTV